MVYPLVTPFLTPLGPLLHFNLALAFFLFQFAFADTCSTITSGAMLGRTGVKVVEGPVERQGGRKRAGTSTYVRDPDGNLLEFMIYS